MKGFHVAINDQNSPLDLDGVDVQIESGVVVHGRSLEHLYIACASEQIFLEVATRLTSWYGGGKESVRVRNQ